MAAGMVTITVPSAPVGGLRVMSPDVALRKVRVPTTEPAIPSAGVEV